MSDEIAIVSRDYWFKIVNFLQQNWALVDPHENGAIVWFVGDTSSVFDKMAFCSTEDAAVALRRNGFHRFSGDKKAQAMMRAPGPPFARRPHPNGAIYSSGRFWS